MRTFGMVSTAASTHYTPLAIKSFLESTIIEITDKFFLIDNDQSYKPEIELPSQFEIITLAQPRSFAANVNDVLEIARSNKSDLYFLNNDLIFSPGWILPLMRPTNEVLSPLSNVEMPLSTSFASTKRSMELADYHGKEETFMRLAQAQFSTIRTLRTVLSLAFFCIKIPHAVYSTVGLLDESFGMGGAEDTDYCLRCTQSGFPIRYAEQSLLLHFSGRSTWAGTEGADGTQKRVSQFRTRFEEKWGKKLTTLLIDHDASVLEKTAGARELARAGQLAQLVELLRTN